LGTPFRKVFSCPKNVTEKLPGLLANLHFLSSVINLRRIDVFILDWGSISGDLGGGSLVSK